MTITKNQERIDTLDDWLRLAAPKSANQWVDGRSAKEVARAWLECDGRELPGEVTSVLSTHQDFGAVREWRAEPEGRLPFDSFPGEPRNSDLVVHAEDDRGPFLLAVEAKADETFGATVGKTLATALERYVQNDRSRGIARIEQLVRALFAPGAPCVPRMGELRYQLLTACAGALCEAERRGYSRALMLVHEFVTDKTSDEKHRLNAADLSAFVRRLSGGRTKEIPNGDIRGPFSVPGAPLLQADVQLYVGKVSRNLRSRGT